MMSDGLEPLGTNASSVVSPTVTIATSLPLNNTSAENIWYALQCIAFGAGYFAKVPMKKALSDAGVVSLTSAENFWYVLMCIPFGAGYFAKVPHKRALADANITRITNAENFWYVLQCVAFGAGYFAKVPVKRALADANVTRTTNAENFWYVLMCIPFGAGYFAKVPYKIALSEVSGIKRRKINPPVIVGIAIAAALIVALVAFAASSHHKPPTVSGSSVATTTPPTTAPSGTTTGTFPPSTTVPTTGLVPLSLTLWSCPTALGITGATSAPLTTPVRVMVPPGFTSSQLAVYTDTQGIMELLAPAGWDCQATVGADGASNIEIAPPGQAAASGSSLEVGSTIEEVRGDQTSASAASADLQACQLFPAAETNLKGIGPKCTMLSPPAEEATLDTNNIIEFTDPPGVAGDGDPSGGAYSASGVMTYYTSNEAGSWTETCVLPPRESRLCGAIISSFIESYGAN
jgi:hypothetical protein